MRALTRKITERCQERPTSSYDRPNSSYSLSAILFTTFYFLQVISRFRAATNHIEMQATVCLLGPGCPKGRLRLPGYSMPTELPKEPTYAATLQHAYYAA